VPFPLMPLSLPLPPVKPHVPFPLCPCGGCGRRGAASQGRSCDTPVCHLGCSTLLSLVAVEAVELPVTICGKGCYRIEPSSASSPRFSQSLAFTGVMSYVVARDANCLSHGETRGRLLREKFPAWFTSPSLPFTSRVVLLPGCTSGLRGVPQLQSLRRSSLTRAHYERSRTSLPIEPR